jgi:transposase
LDELHGHGPFGLPSTRLETLCGKQIHIYRALNLDDAKIKLDALISVFDKRRRFLRHALNSTVRKIIEELREKGISEVIIGYPKEISRNHGNKLTVNFWNYSYVIKRFEEIGEELRMGVVKVDESYTSRTCSLCGEAHEGGRVKRGSSVPARGGDKRGFEWCNKYSTYPREDLGAEGSF